MNASVVDEIAKAASGYAVSKITWRRISDWLLDEIRKLIGTDFERDEEVWVDQGTTFTRWFWSKNASQELSTVWSAVLSGGPVGDNSYSISASLFMFHASTRKRLVTSDGASYLLYSFEFGSGDSGSWKQHGWVADEFGEWKDFKYSND